MATAGGGTGSGEQSDHLLDAAPTATLPGVASTSALATYFNEQHARARACVNGNWRASQRRGARARHSGAHQALSRTPLYGRLLTRSIRVATSIVGASTALSSHCARFLASAASLFSPSHPLPALPLYTSSLRPATYLAARHPRACSRLLPRTTHLLLLPHLPPACAPEQSCADNRDGFHCHAPSPARCLPRHLLPLLLPACLPPALQHCYATPRLLRHLWPLCALWLLPASHLPAFVAPLSGMSY